MAGCKPPCVRVISGTDREKWEYVRDLYYPTRTETRDASDPAYIAEQAELDDIYNEDHTIWLAYYSHVPFEKFMQWYYTYGTYQYNNLPEHKKHEHIGHCFAPCPYDSNAKELRTRHLLDLGDSDPLPTRNDHGIYYMRTTSKGSKWGFECTFDNCPYYVANGQRYFYI